MSSDTGSRQSSNCDNSAEKTALRACSCPRTPSPTSGILQAHDFYEPAHALIYDAVLRVYGAGESPDPVRVPRCSTPPARRPRPEAWTVSAH
ncbi:DnaB-like helicase N-terminal domain-containing protein [Streptomyces sp. NPDC059071]|uniref:DnaB-like helicase N-terminal domain-containing protein n=1 Tax=unclassified Streptomyces TaxID=2593676 RepID=UPI00365022D8